MKKTIAILGTLDTKGEEVSYVKELIQARGHNTIVIDAGILGEPLFSPDFSHDQVAEAGGGKLKEIAAQRDEGKAMAVMIAGATRIVQQLHAEDRLDGIIAVGGSMGTSLGLPVMKALPLGVPKLMVSTVAFTPAVTAKEVSIDQVMFQCVVDMWGLDPITERTLESAAAAISAMAEVYKRTKIVEKPLIGLTTLGTVVCKYAWQAKSLLKQKGYEVAVFHAVGIGGRSFERLIEDGLIAGVLDLCLHEVSAGLYGGWCDAGPHRLEAAGKMGIPQVVAPGGTGFLCWPGPPESMPAHWRSRRMHVHNPLDTVPIMTEEEMAATGEWVAGKLNKATGPAAVLIPTRGFSDWDRPGALFYFPEGRRAFAEALKAHIEPKVRVIELDVHINDPEFIERAVALLDEMMKSYSKPGEGG